VRAQSLADVAKKEEERRKTAPKADSTITNDNLKADDRSPIAPERLAQIRPENRPRVAAAIRFLSNYHFPPTRLMSEYCSRAGAPVEPFVAAFKVANRAEYAQATTILNAEGISEEYLWGLAQTAARAKAEQNLTGPTGQTNCSSVAGDPANAAALLQFSKVEPEIAKVLMSPAPAPARP
jgi:hypothetical protein